MPAVKTWAGSVPFAAQMLPRAAVLRRAFVLAAVTWTVARPLAAASATAPHPSSMIYLFSFCVYLIGSIVCHQRPERSFHLWSAQLPVCARCTGIYAGAAVAAIIALSVAAD